MSAVSIPEARLDPRIVDRSQARIALVFGVEVKVLLNGVDTGGSHALCVIRPAPGTGAPPHVHSRDDETFFVLDGEIEVLRGETWTTAGPGTAIFLPRGVPHAFRNTSQAPAAFISMSTPGGHEQFFLEADRMTREGELNPETAVELCRRFGMELVPPPA